MSPTSDESDQDDYLVFRRAAIDEGRISRSVSALHHVQVWRPTLSSPVPKGFPVRFAAWSAADRTGLFKSRELAVYYIEEGGEVIHRSAVLPAWFRWPFMQDGDLQVSSVWTSPEYRGRRLATEMLLTICGDLGRTHDLWYTSRAENVASLRVAENAGFRFVHTARRRRRLHSRVLGSLELVD